jgi:hypothetical protein
VDNAQLPSTFDIKEMLFTIFLSLGFCRFLVKIQFLIDLYYPSPEAVPKITVCVPWAW